MLIMVQPKLGFNLVVVAVVGGLFLGLWIDRKLGTSPSATLLLLGLGTLVAVIGCYRAMTSAAAGLAGGQEEGEEVKQEVAYRGGSSCVPWLSSFRWGWRSSPCRWWASSWACGWTAGWTPVPG